MKGKSLLSMVFFLALCLCGCGGKSNGLFSADERREYDQLHIITYEEGRGIGYYTEEAKVINELFEKLDEVSVRKAEEWSPELVTYPIYAIVATYNGEESIIPEYFCGYWSNGYYIAADGSAFHFSYDFSKLTDRFTFSGTTEDISIVDMPMSGMLVSDAFGWKKEFLTEAAPVNVVSGLTTQVVELTDKGLTITYEHQGEIGVEFGPEEYVLEVKLDGTWYELPPERVWRTDKGQWHEIIPTGQGTECLDLSVYGTLPKGCYRYVTETANARICIAEFMVP